MRSFPSPPVLRKLTALLTAALCGAATGAEPPDVGGAPTDLAAYVGGAGDEAFHTALPLSDGAVLIGGGADDLNWLPPAVPRVELAAPAVEPDPGAGDGVAFLLHLSATRDAVLRAYTVPRAVGSAVRALKTNAVPGARTGDVFLSVTRRDGYALAKLAGDVLAGDVLAGAAGGAPRGLAWAVKVKAGGTVRDDQPWDVDGAGRITYASGTPHAHDWLAIYRLNPDGTQGVVPRWRTHWLPDGGGEYYGPAADAPAPPTHSGIVLKVWSRGDLRSWDRAGWEEESSDGNGGVKRGRWPFDAMFPGPHVQGGETPDLTGAGRGYYGYKWSATPTAGVGAIVVDRRDGSMIVGGNNKSRLPDGNPDFEPWVVCFEPDGALRWWQRLYPESKGVSTPDQYVDALAIDYSAPARPGALFVAARAHGNNVNNFWQGDAVSKAARPGWQTGFTGTNGNIHYGWLGKLTLDGGEMLAATYVAEFAEGAKFTGATFQEPSLSHWPHFRAGWPDLNTTRIRPHSLHVDAAGRPLLVATGRRVVTTRGAFQQMPSPLQQGTKGRWSDFVRIYKPDLSGVVYSSILNGRWDWRTGAGGSPVDVRAAAPTGGVRGGPTGPARVLLVGRVPLDKNGRAPDGAPMPTRNVPAWAAPDRPGAGDAVFAELAYD